MAAFVVLLLAALSRLLPHALHLVGMNFTAVGAGLLYFGARRPRVQTAVAVLVMALTDVYLTTMVYGRHFHARSYLLTWAWYAGVCLLGHAMLARRTTALRVTGAVLGSATSFFVLSNLAVWGGSQMYPRTAAGLGLCYTAAIPFYGNDLVSTGLVAGALFGLPALARALAASLRDAGSNNNLPAA